MSETAPACKVVGCCYDKDLRLSTWTVFLPDRLLWSKEGMSKLFELVRLNIANPADFPGDADLAECWDSFHILSIEEDAGGYVVLPQEMGNL